MDIKLNEDQVEISRQARRFFEKEAPMEYVRAMFEDEVDGLLAPRQGDLVPLNEEVDQFADGLAGVFGVETDFDEVRTQQLTQQHGPAPLVPVSERPFCP